MKNSDDIKDVKGSVNNLFKGLEGFIGLVGNMIEKGENIKNIAGEMDIPNHDKFKARYDVSMKLGLDGNNTIKEKIIRNVDSHTKIEPNVEIYDDEKEYKIIILTNNVDKEDIRISMKNSKLIFEARNPQIAYFKEIEIPYKTEVLSWTINNGIIKIVILKEE